MGKKKSYSRSDAKRRSTPQTTSPRSNDAAKQAWSVRIGMFLRQPANLVLIALTIATVAFLGFYRFKTDNLTGFERISGTLRTEVQRITEGCPKPPEAEVEAFYKDNNGSIPVDPSFDADPGEICGNGKSMYCTSLPPGKPVPAGWKKPPRPGSDPSYEGPSPFDPFKESPHAMPSSKAVLARKAIVDLKDRDLDTAIDDALSRGPAGQIAMLAPGALPASLARLKPRVSSISAAMLKTDDDGALAAQLGAMGIDYVLYDRLAPPAAAWMESAMHTVALRMRDAVSIPHFQPLVLGSRWALYARTTPFEIELPIKRRLTGRVRAILSGAQPPALDFDLPLAGTGADEHRVLISLRKRSDPAFKGRKVIRQLGRGRSFIEALDSASRQIVSGWSRSAESAAREYGVSPGNDPKTAINDMEIEIDVFYHHCHLTDRTTGNLVWYVEMGLEGLMLEPVSVADRNRLHYMEPSHAVHLEIERETDLLERLFNRANLQRFLRDNPDSRRARRRPRIVDQKAWNADKEFSFRRFRSVNWIERPATMNREIVEIYRGMPLKTIWDVSRKSLIDSLVTGAGWLMTHQTPDGQYAYKYTPMNRPDKRWMPGGNIVRHALNPYTLLMVNKLQQNPEFVKSAKRGIDFSLNFLRHDGNRCVICHRDPPARYYNAKLNAVAVTILSILKLGDVADISEYKDALRCMAEQMLFMQNRNGHFWQYDVPPDNPYYGAESTIHAGEFIFVLSRLYSHYKEDRFKVACDKAIEFYMQQWNKTVSERTPEGIYNEENRVNLIGIVPWLVTAMEDLHRTTGDQKYADLGFLTQNWIDDEFFWWQERAQYPDYVGASFKIHTELPAVNSCQYAEGASAAYAIALRTGKDVEKRRQLVVHSMRFCLQLSFDHYDNTFFLPVPEDAMGGYRYTLGHSRLRNDYNYHAMAAIALAAEHLLPEDYPNERPMRILPVHRELLGGRENPAKDMTVSEYRALKAAQAAAAGQP